MSIQKSEEVSLSYVSDFLSRGDKFVEEAYSHLKLASDTIEDQALLRDLKSASNMINRAQREIRGAKNRIEESIEASKKREIALDILYPSYKKVKGV